MKRVISLILALVIALGMIGCGGGIKEPEPTATPEPTPTPKKTVSIGIVKNYWKQYLNGYTPYLQLEITNESDSPIDRLKVDVYFINNSKKENWDSASDIVIGSSDAPLRPGFKTTAFIQSDIGFQQKNKYLPDLEAEIYINGTPYGIIRIIKTYTENANMTLTPYLAPESIDLTKVEEVKSSIQDVLLFEAADILFQHYTTKENEGFSLTWGKDRDVVLDYDETAHTFSCTVSGIAQVFLPSLVNYGGLIEEPYSIKFTGSVGSNGINYEITETNFG